LHPSRRFRLDSMTEKWRAYDSKPGGRSAKWKSPELSVLP
jgi:hypothetical protein